MAATDLSTVTRYPYVADVTLPATIGDLRRVLIPTTADVRVSVYAVTTAAKLVDGTVDIADDDPIGASAYADLAAGQWIEVATFYRVDGNTFFSLASTAVSPVVKVMLERVK